MKTYFVIVDKENGLRLLGAAAAMAEAESEIPADEEKDEE